MNTEDATNFLVLWMRQPSNDGYSDYGYDVYIPNVIRAFQRHTGADPDDRQRARNLSPHFYAGAWELCRRGIIRPGIRIMDEQAPAEGNAGNGYSVTPFGRQWLSESDRDDYVPTEPGRFAEMLKQYRDRFGPQFQERSQEAIRCYGAHAYLACCVMCGAAAESILLASAIEKTQDRNKVLSAYNSAQGRSRVERLLLDSVRDRLKQEMAGYLTLLKYWRDQAGHGAATNIGDNEAYTSLALLLRLALYANEWWDELTTHSAL
jgi:hypothetical protein